MTSTPTTLELFLEQCCVFAPELSLGKGNLYSAYANFCNAKGETPLHINCVSKALKVRPGITEARTKTARVWIGIKVLETQAAEEAEADQSQASPNLLQIEERKPSVEESMSLRLPSTPKPSQALREESAISAIDATLIRIMLGITSGPQGF